MTAAQADAEGHIQQLRQQLDQQHAANLCIRRQMADELEGQHARKLSEQHSRLQAEAKAHCEAEMRQVQQGYLDQVAAANSTAAR